MLLVKTYIAPSLIHGIGLYAAEPIKKGTVVWRMNARIDMVLENSQIDNLAAHSKDQVARYVFVNNKTGRYVLCGDDARFFNHSETPNCDDPNDEVTIANRNIEKGEELTCDYHIIKTVL